MRKVDWYGAPVRVGSAVPLVSVHVSIYMRDKRERSIVTDAAT